MQTLFGITSAENLTSGTNKTSWAIPICVIEANPSLVLIRFYTGVLRSIPTRSERRQQLLVGCGEQTSVGFSSTHVSCLMAKASQLSELNPSASLFHYDCAVVHSLVPAALIEIHFILSTVYWLSTLLEGIMKTYVGFVLERIR